MTGNATSLATTLNAGSPLFMAPELFSGVDKNGNNVRCTSKVDMFSFAIVFWMILALDEPYVVFELVFEREARDFSLSSFMISSA